MLLTGGSSACRLGCCSALSPGLHVKWGVAFKSRVLYTAMPSPDLAPPEAVPESHPPRSFNSHGNKGAAFPGYAVVTRTARPRSSSSVTQQQTALEVPDFCFEAFSLQVGLYAGVHKHPRSRSLGKVYGQQAHPKRQPGLKGFSSYRKALGFPEVQQKVVGEN